MREGLHANERMSRSERGQGGARQWDTQGRIRSVEIHAPNIIAFNLINE